MLSRARYASPSSRGLVAHIRRAAASIAVDAPGAGAFRSNVACRPSSAGQCLRVPKGTAVARSDGRRY